MMTRRRAGGRSQWVRRTAPALVALLLAAAPAFAGSITISVTPTVEVHDQSLVARTKVTNSGNEAARSVTPVLRFGDKEVRGKGKTTLAPNESMEETLTLDVGELGQGRWPYRFAVDYTDANEYPFQALQVGSLLVGNPPPAKVAVPEMKAGALSTTGSLTVRIKNLSGTQRTATVAVFVPEGLEVATPVPDLTLPAWGEKTVSVPLTNRTALAGSRYPVFANVQYDDAPVHQSVLAQTVVEILAPQSFFGSRQGALWMGAGVLVLVWVAVMLWRAMVRPRDAMAGHRR